MINSIFLLISLFQLSSIYSLSVDDVSGKKINFSDFRGKKILIVNVATNSKYADQLGKLESLHEKYKESLVIIAFPSNDFGNEIKGNRDFKNAVTTKYHVGYFLAAKSSVRGEGASPVYEWLSKASSNGILDNGANGDFYKFLINGEGNIIGVFAGCVDPLSEIMQQAITN